MQVKMSVVSGCTLLSRRGDAAVRRRVPGWCSEDNCFSRTATCITRMQEGISYAAFADFLFKLYFFDHTVRALVSGRRITKPTPTNLVPFV